MKGKHKKNNRARKKIAITPDRPDYRVPTMADVAESEGTNGYRVASTFSGCGGSCLGYKMAGFEVGWASEFVEAAQEVYSMNHPNTILDKRDVRDVRPEDVLGSMGLSVGELDVFEGSPPCDSFSSAGPRDKKWGKEKDYHGKKQKTDDLFFEWVRLLDGLKPKVCMAENVRGLVTGKAVGYFKRIMAAIDEAGYRAKAKVLDAQWLGVPQTRARLIIVGVRKDLDAEPAFPKPLPYQYSILDAIGDLVEPEAVGVHEDRRGDPSFCKGDVTGEPAPCVTGACSGSLYVDLAGTAIGEEASRLGPGQKSGRYFNLVRPHEGEPSPCVTAMGGQRGVASVVHPNARRKFTIAELKRVCSFPDDFRLAGSYSQQWARLGLSVPPVMARAIAETIRDEVLPWCS